MYSNAYLSQSHFQTVIFYIVQKSLQIHMPKAVDIYVLESKIGSGQFGDVYRGYSKVDGQDVAVKTIRRDKIKGKFTELLQNQIQVLKSCKNNNIVRLIDIKKTANNIYLILQYCNEGDLLTALKTKKKFPQQQALEYFVQILHAFQTLVKSKIMHRDFKLANVLKHDGTIKIADFGFAKLLGSQDQQAETILGSPLNMAPEVLDHKPYNSKADIWSIGVGFYEMVFGKVPFTASNIIDLLKKIKKDTVVFPHRVNPQIQDVLRKMLVVDPEKRIQWNDLFRHPVTRLLQESIQQNLRLSLLCKKQEIPLNMSKFYIKTNKVVQNIHDINAKRDLNNYVKEVIQNKEKSTNYQGAFIRRLSERDNKENMTQIKHQIPAKTEKQIKDQQPDQQASNKLQQAIRLERIRNNCKIILHQRNVYAFLGHLAQDLIQTHLNVYYQCLAFLLVKKVITRLAGLKQQIKKRQIKDIVDWPELQKSTELKEINQFLATQEQIFNRFYEKLSLRVLQEGTLSNFEEDLMISGKYTLQETNNRIFERVLREYLLRVITQNKVLRYEISIQLLKLLDCLRIDTKFSQKDFDFTGYYQQYSQTEENIIKDNARLKVQQFISKPLY